MKKTNRVVSYVLSLLFVFSLIFTSSVTTYANDKKSSHPKTQNTTDPENEYLSIIVSNDDGERGKFASGAVGTVTGKRYEILYGWPDNIWSSFSTIKIDNQNYVYGESEAGNFIKIPTDGANLTNESIWKIGNIEVTQKIQIVNNPSTGRKDIGKYSYIIKNVDSTSHNVGTRIMLDTQLSDNDGAPFRVPGAGEVTNEMSFTGNSIPQYYQVFASLDNPDIIAQGMLSSYGATKPDKFAICDWGSISETIWEYTTDSQTSIENDSAVGIWWNPVTIQPGATKEFTTYYGLGVVTGTSNLSITGPAELELEGDGWSPNPFTITAYVRHAFDSTINVPVTLALPEGLVLASEGDNLTHTVSGLVYGETGQTSWLVKAVQSGNWEYSVKAFTGSEMEQTAKRTVLVPQLPTPDTTAPTSSHTIVPSPNSNGWNNSDVQARITSADNQGGWGVDKIFYEITNNSQTQSNQIQGSSGNVPVNQAGTSTIKYWASDKAGNLETAKTVTVKIDKVKPEVVINMTKNSYNKLTDTIKVDFSSDDELSGLEIVEAFIGTVKVENGQEIKLSESEIAPGSQQLKVTAKDKAGNVTVKTYDIFIAMPASGIVLTPETLTLEVGDSKNLTYKFIPENATNKEVAWTTSNSNIAKVENGKVTAVAVGEATITVTSKDGSYSDTCKVKVIANDTLPKAGSNSTSFGYIGLALVLCGGIFMAFRRKVQ